MNFTEGARPTADFGRFGRKNTDSARESMLFLAVSFTFTANNRYFCNIFYPLWRKSTLHFAPHRQQTVRRAHISTLRMKIQPLLSAPLYCAMALSFGMPTAQGQTLEPLPVAPASCTV